MNLTDHILPGIKSIQPLAIALSGGVDSTVLTLLCHKYGIDYKCFTIIGPHITDFEIQRVCRVRNKAGLNHSFFYFDYRLYPEISSNGLNRCFFCKHYMYFFVRHFFPQEFNLVDATNADDMQQFRPGIKAAQMLSVKTPFASLGVKKKQIFEIAHLLGLQYDPLDTRSCILCRFAYNINLDFHDVHKIRSAEDYLLNNGLKGFRLRRPGHCNFLLQIDISQQENFQSIRSGFFDFCRSLEISPLKIDFLSLEEISGYYDRSSENVHSHLS